MKSLMLLAIARKATMMLRVFLFVTAAMLLTLSSAIAAPVAGKKRPVATTRINKALTTEECKGLGGDVVKAPGCGALFGKACQTADKNGVLHRACIDNKKN